jgi:hypothetical protein
MPLLEKSAAVCAVNGGRICSIREADWLIEHFYCSVKEKVNAVLLTVGIITLFFRSHFL